MSCSPSDCNNPPILVAAGAPTHFIFWRRWCCRRVGPTSRRRQLPAVPPGLGWHNTAASATPFATLREPPPPFPALSPSMPHGMGRYGADHAAGPPVRFLRTQVPSAAAVTHSRLAALILLVQVCLSLPAQHKTRTTLVGHAMTGRRQCCTCVCSFLTGPSQGAVVCWHSLINKHVTSNGTECKERGWFGIMSTYCLLHIGRP